MEKTTYFEQLICGNCMQYQGGKIPFGVEIRDYSLMTECIKCGCKKLRKLHSDEQRDF
jgi:hypothetical protein